jgi:predicted nicotinamide N-methyase
MVPGIPSAGPGSLSVLPTDLLFSPGATAAEIRAAIALRYDVDTLGVDVGAEQFSLLHVRDTNRLLDLVSPDEFSRDERLPYWADLWTSSIDLAGWLLEGKQRDGQTVLELGCGIGLAGIAAARAGAHVTLTDYETDALHFARHNALMNLPPRVFESRVRCLPLDWRVPGLDEKFDLIIGADIVYERRNFAPVLALLKTCLHPGGCALFTEPDRTIGQAFLAEARELRFAVHQSFSTRWREAKEIRISRMVLSYESFQEI